MAYVAFKKGLQKNVPGLSNSNAVNGVFYLTSDTNRLYVGNESGKSVLLNQTVQIVDSITNLLKVSEGWTSAEAKQAHINDIYYVSGSNILCIWTNGDDPVSGGWTQINPDHNTYASDVGINVSLASKTATIETEIINTNPVTSESADIKDSFSITAGDGIAITNNDGALTLTGDNYSIGAATNTAETGVVVTLDSNLQTDSSVEIVGDGATSVAIESGKVKISSQSNKVSDIALELTDAGVISGTLYQDVGGDVTFSTDPIEFQIGKNSKETIALGEDLDVYTSSEVDALFKDLNGLKYAGTIGSTGANKLATGETVQTQAGTAVELHNGDMFLVSGSGVYISAYDDGATALNSGDLIICTGTENANGVVTSPVWTYIPSGDDSKTDTSYQFAVNTTDRSLTISASGGVAQDDSGIKISGDGNVTTGSPISVSATNPEGDKIAYTISHKEVTVSEGTDTAATVNSSNGSKKITYISDITDDGFGHITGFNTKETTLPDEVLVQSISQNNGTVSGTGDTIYNVTMESKLCDGGNGNDILDSESYVDFTSQSLQVTSVAGSSSTNPKIEMELVWGTF